jgi:adenylosuccinate synthase
VLDPIIFRKEIQALAKYNVDLRKNLFISKKASLIIPTHRLLDAASEQAKGEKKIGSTLKGIGPTYQDKVARHGLRIGDILSSNFTEKYTTLLERHLAILDSHQFSYDLAPLEKDFFEAVEFMKQFNLVDSEYLINESIEAQETILAEGAQGSY